MMGYLEEIYSCSISVIVLSASIGAFFCYIFPGVVGITPIGEIDVNTYVGKAYFWIKGRLENHGIINWLYEKLIEVEKEPNDGEMNGIATIFFLIMLVVFSFIFRVINIKEKLETATDCESLIIVLNITIKILLILICTVVVQLLYKIIIQNITGFTKVTKHIGIKWEAISFVVASTYFSDFMITHNTKWEFYAKWIRIVFMGIVIICLMMMICNLVIEALKNNLNYDSNTFLKFVLIVIVLQILSLSLIMSNGVLLSNHSDQEQKTAEQSEEISSFDFHYADDTYSLMDTIPSLDNNLNEDDTDTIALIQNIKLKLIIRSMYYVAITYTSVGYGDIYPISPLSRLFSIVVSMMGFIMSAIFIGILLGGIKSSIDKDRSSSNG